LSQPFFVYMEFPYQRFPSQAQIFCFSLWKEFKFHFIVARSRSSKYGDFRVDSRKKNTTITVNHDLHPYLFLLTYLHEVAHLITYNKYKRKVSPHGQEWKLAFQQLLVQSIKLNIYPDKLERVVARYAINPSATMSAKPWFYEEMMKYQQPSELGRVTLKDLNIGDMFELKSQVFQKIQERRTRAICENMNNQKEYLVSLLAEVKLLD